MEIAMCTEQFPIGVLLNPHCRVRLHMKKIIKKYVKVADPVSVAAFYSN